MCHLASIRLIVRLSCLLCWLFAVQLQADYEGSKLAFGEDGSVYCIYYQYSSPDRGWHFQKTSSDGEVFWDINDLYSNHIAVRGNRIYNNYEGLEVRSIVDGSLVDEIVEDDPPLYGSLCLPNNAQALLVRDKKFVIFDENLEDIGHLSERSSSNHGQLSEIAIGPNDNILISELYRLKCLSPSAEYLWSHQWEHPRLYEVTNIIGMSDQGYFVSTDNFLILFSFNGEILFNSVYGSREYYSAFQLADGRVLAAGDTIEIFLPDGESDPDFTPPVNTSCSLVIGGDGTFYAGLKTDPRIVAFDIEGTILGEVAVQRTHTVYAISPLKLSPDGVPTMLLSDGSLLQYPTEAGYPDEHPWPQYGQDPQNSFCASDSTSEIQASPLIHKIFESDNDFHYYGIFFLPMATDTALYLCESGGPLVTSLDFNGNLNWEKEVEHPDLGYELRALMWMPDGQLVGLFQNGIGLISESDGTVTPLYVHDDQGSPGFAFEFDYMALGYGNSLILSGYGGCAAVNLEGEVIWYTELGGSSDDNDFIDGFGFMYRRTSYNVDAVRNTRDGSLLSNSAIPESEKLISVSPEGGVWLPEHSGTGLQRMGPENALYEFQEYALEDGELFAQGIEDSWIQVSLEGGLYRLSGEEKILLGNLTDYDYVYPENLYMQWLEVQSLMALIYTFENGNILLFWSSYSTEVTHGTLFSEEGTKLDEIDLPGALAIMPVVSPDGSLFLIINDSFSSPSSMAIYKLQLDSPPVDLDSMIYPRGSVGNRNSAWKAGSWASWQAEHFPVEALADTETTGAGARLGAVPNRLAYLFGRGPRQNNRDLLPTAGWESGMAKLTAPEKPEGTDLLLEYSYDLSQWFPLDWESAPVDGSRATFDMTPPVGKTGVFIRYGE